MEVGCVTYFKEKGDTTTREHNSTLNEEEALKVVPSVLIYQPSDALVAREVVPLLDRSAVCNRCLGRF